MYTGTIFNWHDNSAFTVIADTVDTTNMPLFMVVNSFDKGPEKLMEVDANTFYNLFGVPTFAKHGQGALQARNIVDAGGRILVKRVCAADSEIANSLLVATVKTETKQKVDSEGQPLYIDTQGNETTDAGYMDEDNVWHDYQESKIPCATISWSVESVEGAKTFKEIRQAAKSGLASGKYALFAISDNGRGISNKAVRVIPDYDTSRGLEQMIYRLNVYEGTDLLESINISLDPDYKFDNEYYGLDKSRLIQVDAEVIPEVFDAYVSKIASIVYSGVDEPTKDQIANVKKQDLIFGYGYNGANTTGIYPETDSEGKLVGTDLSVSYGVEFGYAGTYGAYGDNPADYDANPTGYAEWSKDIANVYQGEDTDNSTIDEVWDVDTHKLFAVVDANYPVVVKDAIYKFVTFRKDCVFFRDYGIGYDNLSSIKARYNEVSKFKTSNFVGDYFTTYEVEDPDSKKNIRVTMLYDLVTVLTEMYANQGPFVPLAGVYNGFILQNAIPGTVNFTPIITPSINQKEAIDSLHVNYAIFEDENTCVVQSTYSSQTANTQLSWLNNTLAIQEVARRVRIACPKNRFQLITNNDLTEYAAAVSRVLQSYANYFDILQFKYTQDPLRITQKIFYASINFGFRNWAQTEIFDLFAVSNLTTTGNNTSNVEF